MQSQLPENFTLSYILDRDSRKNKFFTHKNCYYLLEGKMAKHIGNKIAKFTKYMDLNNNPVSDWHDLYLGLEGMLCIYESEHKAPGKNFIYFYPNEPDTDSQRYFNSISGELTEIGNKLVLETDHRYEFEIGDFLSKDDKELLWLNIILK